MSRSLASLLRSAPISDQADRARARIEEWLSDPAAAAVRDVGDDAPVRALLEGLSEHSTFLWRLATMDAARCARLLAEPPAMSVDRILTALAALADEPGLESGRLMQGLREGRQAMALLVALADLGGVWTLDEVTAALTQFADAAVQLTVRFLLDQAERTGKLQPREPGSDPEHGCGLVVLALGKHGAGELNYSSDIDLVVFFDPLAPRLAAGTVPSPFYVKLVQSFVRLLQERTADGFVVRVDLRLRPDPASTAVAIGLPSAFSYYERLGQNWERAAFIKARPVAGDRALGMRFLADLAPFIWRKYFDYAAIADIHAMKRQIHAVRGQTAVAVAGHNVKLGRGGIREVEFFVQTQQLIFGGRRPKLRGRGTLAMLEALRADGWIDAAAVDDLAAAYRFLRTIEHRLQMVADDQTQRLPAEDGALERFARFAGFAGRTAFAEVLTHHLRRVESHYARLFEQAPALDTAAGSLVFTGTGPDPATVETLRTMGFSRPGDAVETVRGWHFGRRAGVQTPRAREVLTELVPRLLVAFAGSGDPDAALATMDTMLGRMPAAIELLSLLRSNATLLDLFADVLGSAPRLAVTIAARPHVLDAAIDPATVRSSIDDDRITDARIAGVLGAPRTTEAFLDRIREIAAEEQFLIGVRLLSGADAPMRSGEAYSRLADLIIRAALARCLDDFAVDHGSMPGGACVVLGMGKLGSREMTGTSDLDLIIIYRFDPDAASDGPRPLDGIRYYTRIMQRLIAALTAPTRRGRLYEVDLRLRPSGGQGPLATQFRSFLAYQAGEAQTWEHMALSRARVVAGDAALAADVEGAIRSTLLRPRDPAVLQADIRAMRALVAREKGNGDTWDLKLAPGGLLDIEFIAQTLVLRFAPAHPSLLLQSPPDVIREARRLGLLPEDEAVLLGEAYGLQTALAQLTRLTVEGPFDPARAGAGVLRRLCAAANQPDLSALVSALADMRGPVRAILRRWLAWDEAPPAA